MLSDIGIVNAHFNRWKTVCQSPWRWFGLHLGFKGVLMSIILMKQRLFVGFSTYHTEQTYLKSTFEEVWAKEPEFLQSSCTRFREDVIANPYLFRYWQLAKNKFNPMKRRFAVFHFFNKGMVDGIKKALTNPKIVSICFNDSSLCPEDDYNYIDSHLMKWLEKQYPSKSTFEL